MLVRIEVRVGPYADEFRSTDRVRPDRVLDVDGVTYRRQLTVAAWLAVATPDHVIDQLLGIALGVQPTLHDLYPVEIGTDGIPQRGDQKGRGLPRGRSAQVAAHGYALGVPNHGGAAGLGISFLKVPAAKEPDHHARAGGSVGFLALHSIPEGFARVVGGPDGRVAGRADLPIHDLYAGLRIVEKRGGHALGTGLLGSGLAEEVILFQRRQTRVSVRTPYHAELVRVRAELLFQFKSILQSRPGVFKFEHVISLLEASVEITEVPTLEVGKLVVR